MFLGSTDLSQLRDLMLLAGDFGVWEWEVENGSFQFNERWASLLGYDSRDLKPVCETFFERLHPEDRPHVIRELQAHVRGLTSLWRMTYRLRHRDGSWIHFLGHGRLDDGTGVIRRFTGVQTDITQYVQVEREMRLLSERFEIVLGANRVGMWDFDPLSGAVNYDALALQIFGGFRPAQLTLKTWLELVHAEDREVVRGRLESGVFGPIELRFRIRRPSDGLIRHIQLTAQVVRADDGGRQIIGVVADVTVQHQRLKELEDQRLKALRAAKMASLGQMAGGIGHEIKNPLAVIQGAAQVLEQVISASEPSKEKIQREVSRIVRTTERIDRIAQGLCRFARDGGSEAPTLCDLGAIVRETIPFCEDRLRSRGISLQVSLPSDSLNVWCRSVQVSQALINLINNSADAVAVLDEKWIRIEANATPDDVILAVVDSGGGIREEVRARMMEPFFTTKESGQGSGLGLSIVRNLVQINGGALEYDERSPNTRFVVRWSRASRTGSTEAS